MAGQEDLPYPPTDVACELARTLGCKSNVGASSNATQKIPPNTPKNTNYDLALVPPPVYDKITGVFSSASTNAGTTYKTHVTSHIHYYAVHKIGDAPFCKGGKGGFKILKNPPQSPFSKGDVSALSVRTDLKARQRRVCLWHDFKPVRVDRPEGLSLRKSVPPPQGGGKGGGEHHPPPSPLPSREGEKRSYPKREKKTILK